MHAGQQIFTVAATGEIIRRTSCFQALKYCRGALHGSVGQLWKGCPLRFSAGRVPIFDGLFTKNVIAYSSRGIERAALPTEGGACLSGRTPDGR